MEAAGEMVSKLQFMNQDGEWEDFPSDEDIAYLKANKEAMQAMGYALVCQMCNELPSNLAVKQTWTRHEWTCDKCHTINSAGKA